MIGTFNIRREFAYIVNLLYAFSLVSDRGYIILLTKTYHNVILDLYFFVNDD